MIFTRVLRLALFVVLLSLVAFPAIAQEATPEVEQLTIYPVTIESCGRTLTITETPTRVFVDYQTQLELMLRLGLGEYIAGYTGVGEVPLMSDVTNAFSQLEGRATYWESFPAREQAVTAGYDLAIFAFPAYVYDTSRGRATREEWEQNGTIVYESNADCIDSDVVRTIEDSYQQIRDIGRIFNVENRAEALINEMQQTIDMVSSRVDGLPAPRTAILDYIDENGIPYFYAAGIYTDLIELAGGENVFADQQQQYTEVNPEVVAARPIDVLFVMQWEGTISAEEKAEYYFATFPSAPVSQSRRFEVLTNIELNAGSGNAIAVEKMARALHPGAFADLTHDATAAPASAAQTQYPVTVENCGQEITIAARPQRAIMSWGGQAAYMLALGLEEAIIGMYYRFPDEENRLVPPDLREAYLTIPVIGVDGVPPSREVPIALNPDFFYSDNASDFADGRATVEDFASIGATVFSSAYGCVDPELQTLDMMFDEILTLGVIFDVQARAQALVAEIDAGLKTIESQVAGRETVNAVLIEGSSEILYAAGNGLVQAVFTLAGGNNIFDGASYDAPPSREVFATSNPDVILLWDNNAETLPTSFINSVFIDSNAVNNQRIIPIRYIGGIGLRVVELVDALARAFHPEVFE